MKNIDLIAFCGLKQSGKTTAAKHLEQRGYDRYSFAGPLKLAAKLMFCLDDEQVYGSKKEEIDPRWNTTPRDLLQRLGTEVGREFDKSIWIKNMTFRIQGKYAIVIDDCRFPNEADAIKSLGGTVIGIRRPGLVADNHPSELEMVKHWDSMVDMTIVNGTDVDTFLELVELASSKAGE